MTLRHLEITCFALLCIFGMYPANCRSATACQALEQTARAIEKADADLFARLVDLEAISGQALDSFLAYATQPSAATSLSPMVSMLLLQGLAGNETDNKLRGLVLSEAQAFVLNGVASGAFAGKPVSDSFSRGLLAPLFHGASMARKEITGIGDVRALDAGYILPFVIFDHGNAHEYAVEGFFAEENGQMRLKSLVNMDALVRQIMRESQE